MNFHFKKGQLYREVLWSGILREITLKETSQSRGQMLSQTLKLGYLGSTRMGSLRLASPQALTEMEGD
jgi:hypothetical protein